MCDVWDCVVVVLLVCVYVDRLTELAPFVFLVVDRISKLCSARVKTSTREFLHLTFYLLNFSTTDQTFELFLQRCESSAAFSHASWCNSTKNSAQPLIVSSDKQRRGLYILADHFAVCAKQFHRSSKQFGMFWMDTKSLGIFPLKYVSNEGSFRVTG